MLFSNVPTVLALTLAGATAVQDEPVRSGFDALAADPYAAGVFQELDVAPGPPTRVLAQTVSGSEEGIPFVNVLRWADARAFQGQLIAVRLPVQLDAPSLDTSARLWVRVLRADGTIAFEDDGLDSASSSSEWTTLSSIGAVAEDATDLCFGLVVQGTTQVRMHGFELEVLGDALPDDLRHAVPERWANDPDVSSKRVADANRGLDLRVTSFIPAGHSIGDLPHLWLLRDDDDLRRTYSAGRALLRAIRLAQDPPAIVSLVQPQRGGLPETLTRDAEPRSILHLLDEIAPELTAGATQVVASSDGAETPSPLLAVSEGGLTPADIEDAARALEGQLVGDDFLRSERVLLRWMCARHDSGGDAQLERLLFEASLETLEPWASTSTVQQASHSLVGHECEHGHDHSHDHGHHH